MRGHLVLFVLLCLMCDAPTRAAGPADDPIPVPPGMILDGPALTNDQTLTDSGPMVSVLPATASPRHVAYRGFETPQRSDDCNCCGEYFGGFGPLWETYCADKHRCWGAAAACGSSRCYPSCGTGGRPRCAPLFNGSRWQMMRARICGAACRLVPSSDCDCAAPAMMEPDDATSEEVGEPAAPTPAQPDESVQPVPSPPPDPPAADEAVTTSSRRGWLQQRGGGLPR